MSGTIDLISRSQGGPLITPDFLDSVINAALLTKLPISGGTFSGPLTNGAIAETASDLQPARHLSNLIGKTSAVVCIIGDSTATGGPDQVGTAGGAVTANGVDPSQMLWAMLCDKLRTDNPQITSWTFSNFAIGATAENAPLLAGSALNVPLPSWFTDPSQIWLSYVQAAAPDVLFYLFGTNASASGAPPPGGGGGSGASTFISDNLAAIDAWAYTPNVVIVTNKTSSPADTTAGPDDLNSSNHLGQASFHRTFARSAAAGYTAFPKCKAKGFGLVDLGRYAAARLYGYDPAAQYMRAIAATIRTGIPLVTAQLNVAGPGTVAKSTHGDFRLTFVLRGMGGSGLSALGVASIDIGMSNFLSNHIRLNIGSPQPAGTLWPGYIVDGFLGAPSQFGTPVLTTAGQDVVVTASASGPHIRVWINGTLALDVLGARFVTPTYGGGCPINVVTNVAPTGSPTFDVTEFYEGVGSPVMMTMDYAATFGTHLAGSGTLDGYQGGNAINHQTSLSAAYDRRVIGAMNFSVIGGGGSGGGIPEAPVDAFTYGRGSVAWQQVLPLIGGTLTGVLNGPSFNATGSGYYQFGQLLASATNQTNGATFFGFSAGAAAIAAGSGLWLTAIGWGAGQFADGVNENTAVGGKAMNALLPGASGNTCVGVAALMLDSTGVSNTAIGNDAMRNTEGALSGVGIGHYTLAAGSPKNSTAVGSLAQTGNSLSVIVGGTATAGDVLQLTFTGTFTGSPRTVSYTVAGGNTTTQMASGLTNAINTDAVLLAIAGRFLAVLNSPANNSFGIQYDGTSTLGLAIVGTSNVTGAATETLTIGGGNMGQNNLSLGYLAMPALTMTSASNNVALGTATLQGLTSATGNVAIGRSAGQNISSGGNNVALGDLALVANTTGATNVAIGNSAMTANDVGFNNVVIGGSAALIAGTTNFKNNVLIGRSAGQGMTSGGSNIIIGAMNTATSQTQVTTGTNNLAIGAGASVATATASGQMAIQNAIYGTGNNGVDATVSDGRIGFFNKAPTAALTLGAPTTSGAHISVVAPAPAVTSAVGTPTIDANATDVCGTVTGGTSSTGITITFAKSYLSTIPHAVVSARDGLTFTYTVSLIAITITHAAATGRVFDYMVIQ